MGLQVQEEESRATIADLEVYGLSVKRINALEELFGFLYVDELVGLTEQQVALVGRGKRGGALGPDGIRQLRFALRNFVDGRPVRTPADCVVFRAKRRN